MILKTRHHVCHSLFSIGNCPFSLLVQGFAAALLKSLGFALDHGWKIWSECEIKTIASGSNTDIRQSLDVSGLMSFIQRVYNLHS